MENIEGSKKVLVQKINQVMKTAGNVPKAGVNEFHKYSYRKHEDIMAKLGPALGEAGLVMFQKDLTVLHNEAGHLTVSIKYEITDGAAALEFVGIGEGRDVSKDGKPGDKAAYKAQTGAFKYALNVLLAMGDQEDAEAHSEQGKAAPAKAASQPAPKDPPAAAPSQARSPDSVTTSPLHKRECGRISEAASVQKLSFIFTDFMTAHKNGKLTNEQLADLQARYQAKDAQLKAAK